MTTFDFDSYYQIPLAKGAHNSPEDGLCLMELTAMFAREQHSDHPKCVSPVLGEFGRSLNDVLPDDLRQELKGLIPSLPGTANDGFDERRGYMALDWLIRTWLPAWLERSPVCREDARKIRELGRIVDVVSAERAGPVVREAQKNASAAWSAARSAAWSTAWSAAGSAAWSAAESAAGSAARSAAKSTAWSAAWSAAESAARSSAWFAARSAASELLAPTVRELQLSAIDLFAQMIKDPQ